MYSSLVSFDTSHPSRLTRNSTLWCSLMLLPHLQLVGIILNNSPDSSNKKLDANHRKEFPGQNIRINGSKKFVSWYHKCRVRKIHICTKYSWLWSYPPPFWCLFTNHACSLELNCHFNMLSLYHIQNLPTINIFLQIG